MRDILGMIERLTNLIDEETGALLRTEHSTLGSFVTRKGQLLLEFQQLPVMVAKRGSPPPEMAVALARLRERIEVNERTLKQHLDAVHQVVAVLSEAIKEAESDGTYSRGICQMGGRE